MNKQSVAIIILNWNNYEDSLSCLKSLCNLKYNDFKVYFVDNNSVDNSFCLIKDHSINKEFPSPIEYIKSDSNIGFAGGNNLGIVKALEDGYEYIWLLNNDTVVDANSLYYLMLKIQGNEKVGIVGSKIYYYDTKKIWFAGGCINKFIGRPHHLGVGELDRGQYNKVIEVDYITGCSLLFKSELVQQIGFMKEDYFLYFEEVDWNIRAKKKGWNILYVPESIVYHKVSASSGGKKDIAPYVLYYDIRNAYVMVVRTQPKNVCILAMSYMFYKAIRGILKIFLLNQNKKTIRIKYIGRSIADGINLKMGKHPDIV